MRVRVKKPRDGLATAESQNAGAFPGNVLVVPSPVSFAKGSDDLEIASFEKGAVAEELPAPTTTGLSFADEPVTAAEDDSLGTTPTISRLSLSAAGSGPEEEIPIDAEKTVAEVVPEPAAEPVASTIEPAASTLTPVTGDSGNDDLPRIATTTSSPEPLEDASTTVTSTATTTSPGLSKEKQDQEQLSKFLGSTTSTKVSMETEICFRGRCIKTRGGKDPKQQAAKDQVDQLDQVPVE